MRPGIWQEFDGYEAIAAEIEVSRRINPGYVAEREAVGQYIDRLHPKELPLKVADVITETDRPKQFDWWQPMAICRHFKRANISAYIWLLKAFEPQGPTAFPPSRTKGDSTTSPSSGCPTD